MIYWYEILQDITNYGGEFLTFEHSKLHSKTVWNDIIFNRIRKIVYFNVSLGDKMVLKTLQYLKKGKKCVKTFLGEFSGVEHQKIPHCTIFIGIWRSEVPIVKFYIQLVSACNFVYALLVLSSLFSFPRSDLWL